jgi:polyhydroxybutyrate depolymerase
MTATGSTRARLLLGALTASIGFQLGEDRAEGQTTPTAASSPASPDSCPQTTLAPGDHARTLKSGGRTRSYALHVPPVASRGEPLPLVLSFHGGAGTGARHEATVRFRPKADERGFLLVTPEGTGPRDGAAQTWNAGNCCGRARDTKVDDVGFVRDLLDAVQKEACVDPKRVFATGFSNGSMLSHRLGCELADRIAAIAPVGGGLGDEDRDAIPPRKLFECRPPRPVPVLAIHGLEDGCYPYAGGAGEGLSGETKIGIRDSMSRWTSINRCSPKTWITYERGAAKCMSWAACAAETTLCTIEDGGHAWPGTSARTSFGIVFCGGGVVSRDLIATDAIWDFFATHPMTRPMK